mgnify:CR=1 FL=1
MNEIAPAPRPLPTTQAAEGLPRLRWTLAQFERLIELGIFTEDDRIELIDGELIPMAAKGNRHERIRGRLSFKLSRTVPQGLIVYSEPGWRPGGDRYLEPDIIVCPEAFDAPTVPPSEVLLLIEVSDTSLAYDAGLKARSYAALGVREYWVVDAVTLSTRVYRDPGADGYGARSDVRPAERLTPSLVPELAMAMSDLRLE